MTIDYLLLGVYFRHSLKHRSNFYDIKLKGSNDEKMGDILIFENGDLSSIDGGHFGKTQVRIGTFALKITQLI